MEQTQLNKEKNKWGLSFGSALGDNRVFVMDGGSVPAGMESKFSVTYKNGEKKIIKAMSGTEL